MIALATLAALGEAIHEAQAEAAIAAICIAVILAAAVAALVIPRSWLDRLDRWLRKTRHGPRPRCDLCGHEGPLGRFGALVACVNDEACDKRRRERPGAEGAGE